MMGELFVWFIILFAFIRLVVSFVNALSPLHLPNDEPYTDKLVSVLIPARNEAHNLPVLLESIVVQEYPNIEILVYDDHSEDNTASIVKLYAKRDSRVSLLSAKELPGGWLGKNFACHNLANHAKGEYYLFLDADVRVSSKAVKNSLTYMKKYKLDLLSVFPYQKMVTKGEWLTVPLMNWILLSLLPLVLVRKSKRPSLSAANGQFMFFRASKYDKYQWHKQVKGSLVEDIVIIRKMKSMGLKAATLLGNSEVRCRMYTSFKDGLNGFAKNVIEFFGGNSVAAILFTVFVWSGILIPFLGSLLQLIIYVMIILLMRIFISLSSKQSVQKNLFFHVPQMIIFIILMQKALRVKRTGRYTWKGRKTG